MANKENVQDEGDSEEEEEMESEGEFEDGDKQSLVGSKEDLDWEGVSDDVPPKFK